jgi:hypothetical protein
MIRNSHGRFMQHHELYPVLAVQPSTGIVGTRLPQHGFDVTVHVLGQPPVRFVCDPSPGLARRATPHRLKFECRCGRLIPFGRAAQHLRARGHP